MMPNPPDTAQLATQLGTKIQSTGFLSGLLAQALDTADRFDSISLDIGLRVYRPTAIVTGMTSSVVGASSFEE